jgi:hypothetical protein
MAQSDIPLPELGVPPEVLACDIFAYALSPECREQFTDGMVSQTKVFDCAVSSFVYELNTGESGCLLYVTVLFLCPDNELRDQVVSVTNICSCFDYG